MNVTFAGSPTSPGDVFTFTGPTVTRIDPNEGPEDGTIGVDLFGTKLSSNMEASFGDVSVPMICDNSTHCVVGPPRGTGTLHVVVGATEFLRAHIPTRAAAQYPACMRAAAAGSSSGAKAAGSGAPGRPAGRPWCPR
jgi:hypothetical protein